jgi:hypothetical protein
MHSSNALSIVLVFVLSVVLSCATVLMTTWIRTSRSLCRVFGHMYRSVEFGECGMIMKLCSRCTHMETK